MNESAVLEGGPVKLKWVVIVEESLPSWRAVNAAVCVAAATSEAVPGLIGPVGEDAEGVPHPGLPWAGCTILSGSRARLAEVRAKAAVSDGVFVADMPAAAQATRVYDEYLQELFTASGEGHDYLAVSIVGPRNRVDRLAKGLPLLS